MIASGMVTVSILESTVSPVERVVVKSFEVVILFMSFLVDQAFRFFVRIGIFERRSIRASVLLSGQLTSLILSGPATGADGLIVSIVATFSFERARNGKSDM